MEELTGAQKKNVVKQFNKMMRKAFDRWHERTLKRVEKIFKEWEEEKQEVRDLRQGQG